MDERERAYAEILLNLRFLYGNMPINEALKDVKGETEFDRFTEWLDLTMINATIRHEKSMERYIEWINELGGKE